MNRRLVKEKDIALLAIHKKIDIMAGRISKSIEEENYQDANGMRAILLSLKEEKELTEAIPTWPWRPATFRSFVSAIFLPIVIWLIQELLGKII